MEVVLDGTQIMSESDLHRMLSEKLDFGPYYGHNLAALWDRLTTDVERPIHLVWRNAAHSQKSMGEDIFGKIIHLFREEEKGSGANGTRITGLYSRISGLCTLVFRPNSVDIRS